MSVNFIPITLASLAYLTVTREQEVRKEEKGSATNGDVFVKAKNQDTKDKILSEEDKRRLRVQINASDNESSQAMIGRLRDGYEKAEEEYKVIEGFVLGLSNADPDKAKGLRYLAHYLGILLASGEFGVKCPNPEVLPKYHEKYNQYKIAAFGLEKDKELNTWEFDFVVRCLNSKESFAFGRTLSIGEINESNVAMHKVLYEKLEQATQRDFFTMLKYKFPPGARKSIEALTQYAKKLIDYYESQSKLNPTQSHDYSSKKKEYERDYEIYSNFLAKGLPVIKKE